MIRLNIGVAFICLIVAPALEAQLITFDRQIPIAGDEFRYGEPSSILCSDPTNSNRLVGAQNTQEPSTAGKEGRWLEDVFLSTDRGRTWTRTLRTDAAFFGDPDPACAFGPDGTAFLGAIRVVEGRLMRGYSVWHSQDGGRTWEDPVVIGDSRGFDRAFMVVDCGRTPFHGRLYVHGYALTPGGDAIGRQLEIVTYTSDDRGRTFAGPFAIPAGVGGGAVASKGTVHNGTSALLADGSLLLSWLDLYTSKSGHSPQAQRTAEEEVGRYQMMVSRSTDGGRTFEAPIVVSRGESGFRWCELVGNVRPGRMGS